MTASANVPRRLPVPVLPFQSLAVGVGHQPKPVAQMGSVNGGSGNTVPLRIVPERGQVPENSLKSPSKQICCVFHDRVEGSKFANEARVLRPQATLLSVDPGPSMHFCPADVGTWKPPAHDIDPDSICGNPLGAKCSHVIVDRHLRPMLRQHAPAEPIDFAKRDGLESGALQAERKGADAGEQVEHVHFGGRCHGRAFIATFFSPHAAQLSRWLKFPAVASHFAHRQTIGVGGSGSGSFTPPSPSSASTFHTTP